MSKICGKSGLLGTAARQLSAPPATFRIRLDDGSYQWRSLPARLYLRPLAGHIVWAYTLIFIFLVWLLGPRFGVRIAFLAFSVWAVRLLASHFLGRCQKTTPEATEMCDADETLGPESPGKTW